MGTAVQGRDGHVRMPGGRLKDGKEVGEEQQWAGGPHRSRKLLVQWWYCLRAGDITGLYRSVLPKPRLHAQRTETS